MSDIAAADPDADATVREFIDYTEYLPSDINRYLWRIRDLHTRHDESRAQLDEHLKGFAHLAPLDARAAVSSSKGTNSGGGGGGGSPLSNGVNGLQRVMDAVSDREMELRLLISQCLNNASQGAKEAAVEAERLEEHVERHRSRIVAIHGKLDTIEIPSRDPTPEVRKPKQKPEDSRVRITLRLNNVGSSSPQPQPQPPPSTVRRRVSLTGRTPARRPPKTPIVALTEEEDEEGWEDLPETPFVAAAAGKPRKKKGFTLKRGPKPPPADPLLSGGAPSRFPDGTLIPNEQLPWNQLTNEELARLRKRMKKNSSWTPSVTMIVRELEALNRGPNHKINFRDQWEGKEETFIGPEEGGIGDPQKILPDDGAGARENKGMRLNRAKKRKREEERRERAREAERSGLDPIENEKKVQEEEQERQRKEQQQKRRKKREEEEAVRLARENIEREAVAAEEAAAAEKAAREEAEREARAKAKVRAAAEARARVEREAKAKAQAAAQEKVERELQEKLAREKDEKAKAEAAAAAVAAEVVAAAATAKKQSSNTTSNTTTTTTASNTDDDSDDDLSDVPDTVETSSQQTIINTSGEAKNPPRTSKRQHSARPPSRISLTRGISTTPRPRRSAAASVTPAPRRPTVAAVAAVATPAAAAPRRRKRKDDTTVPDDDDEDLNKYCMCDEVSRGTMVACENDDCPKVWFHITCVGLNKEQAESPDLKWYCPICRDETGSGSGRAKRRRKK